MKKAQATTFIILGIILVIAIFSIYKAKDYIIKTQWELERQRTATVPSQAQDIKIYIDSCIKEIAEEGVIIMGMQGGYINLPEDPIPATPANPFSNTLSIFQRGNLRVAYWYYKTANGIDKSQLPTVEQMENELASYINENLDSCINSFRDFPTYNISAATPTTQAEIEDDEIFLTVTYPIRMEYKDFGFEFDKFYEKIEVPLGELYDISKQIFEQENQDYYLEEKTIDMMVLYDEIPFSGTEFECGTKIWSKTNVIKGFKEVISKNVPFIQIKGTDYTLAEPSHSYFEWNALDKEYKDVTINTLYSTSWPFYLEVYPSDGDLLQSDVLTSEIQDSVMKFLTSLFCINNYNFVYDVKYPLIFILEKEEYIFQFATQVVIDNNQPRENKLGILDLPDEEKTICKNPTTKTTISVSKIEADESLTPLENADVSFKCITTVCGVGSTDKKGETTTLLTPCLNSMLSAAKEGFHPSKIFISTNEESSVSILLEPYYSKEFEVKVIDKSTGLVREPRPTEQIIFQLENTDADYSTTIAYPSEEKKIKLIPGDYKVKSHLIENSTWGIIIAEKQIRTCVEVPKGILGVFGATEEKCTEATIPSITLEQAITGGAEFDWNIDRSLLASDNKLILYTVFDTFPTTYDDLTDVYEKITDNAKSTAFMLPGFEEYE